MPDFELNLASMVACEAPGSGNHAYLYRTLGRTYLKPLRIPLGDEPVPYEDPRELFARIEEAHGRPVPPVTAIDIARECQEEKHVAHRDTVRFSSVLELVGSVVLASRANVVPINQERDLWQPNKNQPDIYSTMHVLGDERQGYVPANVVVQDRLRTETHRHSHKINAIVRAAISDRNREAYVALWGPTKFMRRPR